MHASLVGGDSRFAIERVRTHLPDEGVLTPLSGYSLAPTKPIRGSTEATSHPIWPEHHSNWGRALVATGSTMHTKTTGVNNQQTGPQHDKRNCKGNSSVSTRHGQRPRTFQ